MNRSVLPSVCAASVIMRLIPPILATFLLSGCTTMSLWQATDYKHNRVVKAAWSVGEITEAYMGPEEQILLIMKARQPRERKYHVHHVVIPYGILADAVALGRIEQREDYSQQPYDVLVEPLHRAENGAAATPFRVRFAIPRRYGLYPRPGPQPFPLRIGRGALREGVPDFSEEAWQDWRAIPVRHFEHPIITRCSWHTIQTLDPPTEDKVAVYQGFCSSLPTAFALVADQPLLGHNYSLAFNKPDDEYYQAWYQREWIVGLRLFTPATVAFDIVTAPIQIPVFFYLLHNIDWF